MHICWTPARVLAFLTALLCVHGAHAASTQGSVRTAPQELRTCSTLHSIGIEWDILGDTNHNAECTVRFRREGKTEWRQALPLFRVDYAWYYHKSQAGKAKNTLAGSILFLTPGTPYEIRLDLNDPDGGRETRQVAVRTRPVPVMPAGGRTFHVVPGEGGGTGTPDDPFRGIVAAESEARPGDVLLLHRGDYGSAAFDKGGAEGGRYVVWKAAGDGDAVFRQVRITAGHVWLDGLTVQRQPDQGGPGIRAVGKVVGAVLTRNRISGYNYCILLSRPCRDWYIADNVIVGDKALVPGQRVPKALSGEGIELAQSIGGHVICYNSISKVADGISYPGHDCDVYGNDIFDVSDDALEPDRGWANNRFWGNRIANVGFSALSFQPMHCGPWYFVRNQIVAGMHRDNEIRAPHIFKFRVQDRFALVNNTIVFAKYLDVYMDCLFTSLCRNNLFISSTGAKPIWIAMRYKSRKPVTPDTPRHTMPLLKPDWRTDVDYNAYDWGDDTKDWRKPVFRYDGAPSRREGYCSDLVGFSKLLGIEKHGIRVRKEDVFDAWRVPSGVAQVPPLVLTLKKGGPAVDAGSPLPNIVGAFTGEAPDLGAFELGRPLMHFGPRDEQAMGQHALYWALF